jgi:AcrR family transcriptional regulator
MRKYDSALRAEHARQTQRQILATARNLLLKDGYQAMTVTRLAREAGVSVQTVYNTVGGKPAVLKAVYDVALAGDDEPMPMALRPSFQAVLDAGDATRALTCYAAFSRGIYDRAGGLLRVLLAQAAADPELVQFAATIDSERRAGNTSVVRHLATTFGLPESLTEDRAIDIVWTLTAPEVADRLIGRCQWSSDDYETWLARTLCHHLAAPKSRRVR